MRDGFKIFDTHTHIGHARHSGRSASADDLLRSMDRFGVDRSVVIPFPVVSDYQHEHNLIGRAVREYPDRLVGAACINPYIPLDEFRDEVQRCRQEYGFRALKLQPQYHGLNPFSTSSNFFFEAALDNGMAVICHTGSGVPFSLPSACMMPARRYPDLTIVVAHCGGGLLMHESILAATFCPNIVLELSSLMPHHILDILAEVPADRIMAGSDLPESVEVEFGKILTLDIPDGSKRSILYDTGCRVFGHPC